MVLKQWIIEAISIEYGQVTIWVDSSGDLRWRRPYTFLDADGHPIVQTQDIEGVVETRLDGSMPWADVPVNIQIALTEIDTFTKQEILIKEGL